MRGLRLVEPGAEVFAVGFAAAAGIEGGGAAVDEGEATVAFVAGDGVGVAGGFGAAEGVPVEADGVDGARSAPVVDVGALVAHDPAGDTGDTIRCGEQATALATDEIEVGHGIHMNPRSKRTRLGMKASEARTIPRT